jgi:hypothetical protein
VHDFLQNNPEFDKHVGVVLPEEALQLCNGGVAWGQAE